MTDSQSHYDVLGVSEDASQDDIKSAFFELVREHPPEQDPDAYQQLREAYDVLSDPVSRREYDTMAQHGDEIEALQEEAEALLNQDPPATKTAIKKLKRATVLGPDISLLRNMLGNAYLMDGQPEEALTQFDEAVDLNPDNEAHHLNRGYALRELERPREAEEAFRVVWEDEKGNYAAARGVAGALADRERYRQAHEVLDEAIWADDVLNFEDFFCYYDKLHLYLAQQETDALERALDTVTEMVETPEDRQYAAFMLVQTADELQAAGAFGLAHRFGEVAMELDERSVDPEVVEQVGELRDLKEDVEAIMDSDRFHEAVQQMVAIYYDQFTGAMSERQAEEATENLVEGLDNLMQADPDHTEIKKSLRRIRSRHPKVFDLNPEFFEAILDVPDAELFVDDCPHCGEPVMAEKGLSAALVCPNCSGQVYSDGESYRKTKGQDSRNSTSYQAKKQSSNIENKEEGKGSSSVRKFSCSDCSETTFKKVNGGPYKCPSCGGKMELENPNTGGDCFVATAVYGNVDHPDVRRLRRFRDETLQHTTAGRAFIAWYYRYGPALAEWLEGHRRLKRTARWALRQVVARWLR